MKSFAMFIGSVVFWALVFVLLQAFALRTGYEGLVKVSGIVLVALFCCPVFALVLALFHEVVPGYDGCVRSLGLFFVGFWLLVFVGAGFCPAFAARIDYAAPCSGIVKEKHEDCRDWRLFFGHTLGGGQYVVLEDASGRCFEKHILGVVYRVIEVGDHIEKNEGIRQPLQVNAEVPAIPAKTWAAEIFDDLCQAIGPF